MYLISQVGSVIYQGLYTLEVRARHWAERAAISQGIERRS